MLRARLGSFYFVYFATLGIFIPYWSLYLQSVGFSPQEIGILMAAVLLTRLVAPGLWGWLADRRMQRMAIVRIAAVMATACFSGVYFARGFAEMLLVLTVFSVFWNGCLPQFEAVTMNHLGLGSHRYGTVRLWGSIGFVVTSAACGPLLARAGIDWLPTLVLTGFCAVVVASAVVPDHAGERGQSDSDGLGALCRRPAVLALFAVCFLNQASHGPYYGFFSIHLEAHGYTRGTVGALWALGVVAEVALFTIMHRLLPRFGARTLMLLTLVLTTFRWLLIAWVPEYIGLLLFAQVLHAFSFGMYHAVSISLIHQFFRGPVQGRGQALYSSFSFGAGGSVGLIAGGFLWNVGGAAMTFTACALMAAVGFGLAWVYLRPGPAGELRTAASTG